MIWLVIQMYQNLVSVTCLLGCPSLCKMIKGGIALKEVTAIFTVLFVEPFWVGLYERTDAEGYQICRTVFGSEPSDGQLYDWLQCSFAALIFSPVLQEETLFKKVCNPKRMQRQIQRQLRQPAELGTKAQQALKLQQEQSAELRKAKRKQQTLQQQEERYVRKLEKKKAKHRGK